MFSNGTITHVFGNGKASVKAQNDKGWLNRMSLVSTSVKRVRFSRKNLRAKREEHGGQTTQEEYTTNTIYELLTKPMWKCLSETLLTPTTSLILPRRFSLGAENGVCCEKRL
ncbi:hypothetical protein Bca4012_043822 [Brassica carinata]|uniref:Uncharacterized protein n=1 Tax=Brassica carinata TaxID=52824 RepID=A0A8X7UEP9_BRACI|nr:hypothetical protein Bca52824_058572 [Brassica carinata]